MAIDWMGFKVVQNVHLMNVIKIVVKYCGCGEVDAWNMIQDFDGDKGYGRPCAGLVSYPPVWWTPQMIGELIIWLDQ